MWQKYTDFVALNKVVHKINNEFSRVEIMVSDISVEEIRAHSRRTNNATATHSICNVIWKGRPMNLSLHSYLTKNKYFVWHLKENFDIQILVFSKR